MTFTEIIDLWPAPSELASDINEKPGTVRKWKTRNSIPAEKWLSVIHSANSRRIDLSMNDLAVAASSAAAA